MLALEPGETHDRDLGLLADIAVSPENSLRNANGSDRLETRAGVRNGPQNQIEIDFCASASRFLFKSSVRDNVSAAVEADGGHKALCPPSR
eukprot:COSAG02_NODE_2106_length_9814_cov_3.447864_4_plen_91_part_00